MTADFMPWLITASLIGIFIVVKAKKKDDKTDLTCIEPVISKKIELSQKIDKDQLIEFLRIENFKIKDEDGNLILADSASISFFHWGFYYILEILDNSIEIGIFGKGANPPSLKSQEKRLDEFIDKLKENNSFLFL